MTETVSQYRRDVKHLMVPETGFEPVCLTDPVATTVARH